jgi:hypothetical protein
MTLVQKIMALYPELTIMDFMNDVIVVRNDSNGTPDYLAQWNHPTLTRPTQAQLDSVEE